MDAIQKFLDHHKYSCNLECGVSSAEIGATILCSCGKEEAAEQYARLTEENARLREDVGRASAEVLRLEMRLGSVEARNKALTGALRPFAECWHGTNNPCYNDFERAAALVKGEQG